MAYEYLKSLELYNNLESIPNNIPTHEDSTSESSTIHLDTSTIGRMYVIIYIAIYILSHIYNH
jgi:hypothetical protein